MSQTDSPAVAPTDAAPIVLLHTVAGLAARFQGLMAHRFPGVRAVHLVDESLLQDTIRHGMLPATRERVAGYVDAATRLGARAVLVTCSSIGEAAEAARSTATIPVLRVDEPMARAAVAGGPRIGLLATLASTLEPTERLIRRLATESGAEIELTSSVCAGAFEALGRGESATHDRIVAAEIARVAAAADVVVLAQASMARVVEAMPEPPSCPVLSSPASGVGQLADLA